MTKRLVGRFSEQSKAVQARANANSHAAKRAVQARGVPVVDWDKQIVSLKRYFASKRGRR